MYYGNLQWEIDSRTGSAVDPLEILKYGIVKVYVIHRISIVFVALQHVCPLSGTSIEVSARDVMPSRSAAHCEDPP